MPPKRNRVQGGNARSRASAVPQGVRQRRARPESEDVTDQPAATQIRVEEARQPQWTMSSTVEDILLKGRTLSTNMRLNDFLRNYVGGRAAVDADHNVTMEVFVQEPDAYVQDQQLLEEILNLPEYQALEERKILLEAIYKLHHERVVSLEQWRDYYEGKDTVAPLARRKLKEVLTQVLTEERREAEEKARREQQQIIFNLSAKIEDLLFKGSVRVMDIKLNDFLTLELDGGGILRANRNVLLRDFFINPTSYIRDAGVLNEIQATGAYARMEGTVREQMGLEEAVYRLHHEGVLFLEQWRDYQGKDTVTPAARTKLKRALTQVLREERREEVERARREGQVGFTLTTTIEGVLFKGGVRVIDTKLNDFLTMELDGRGILRANRNVLLRDFFKQPASYIRDAEVLNEIQKQYYALKLESTVREEMELEEDVRSLHENGVNSLAAWSEATAKVKASVRDDTKHFLNAAAEEARKPTTTSAPMKLEGCYESVYNARWHHVVEISDGEGTGMEVKDGEPSQSWSYREVDESLERDDGVEQSGAARLRLMVLASDKGWPYSWAGNKLIHDCYVNCEVERVWQIVKGDLTKWFSTHGGNYFEPKRRVLIGTPGIGKSMGAGSYLLYQLLHCDAEKLSVVVYVIGRQAFLFDKTTHTTIRYMELSAMERFLAFVSSRGVKGYIIYDVAKGGRNPSVFFVPSEWGMLVVTSPNVDNFEEWRKHKGAAPIVINCPEEMDVKAMCFWMKHIQPTEEEAEEQLEKQTREQAKCWETVEERMDKVGPIPRCIFSELEYRIRLTAIDTAVKDINASNSTDYMGVGRSKIWIDDYVSQTIVKFVRVRAVSGIEVGYNAPVSRSAMATITYHLTNMTPPVDVFNLLLRNFGCFLWVVFEYAGTAAFMNPHAVDIIQRKLTELQPEGRSRSRFSVLGNKPRGHPTRSKTLKKLSDNPARMNLECGVLYQPVVRNFPLVDALFFMESPRRTLLGCRRLRQMHATPKPAL